jgi:hypothetical protein
MLRLFFFCHMKCFHVYFLVETEAEALMLGGFRCLLLIVFIEFTGALHGYMHVVPLGSIYLVS